MRSLTMRSILVVVLVSLLGAASPLPALANHYEYVGQDPSRQLPTGPKRSWNYLSWTVYGQIMRWWAAPELLSDARLAVNNWNSAIPQLSLAEVADETLADLKVIVSGPTCEGGRAPACYVPTNWEYLPLRNAEFWVRGTIIVDLTYSYAPGGVTSVIAHELGHAFGLHERYRDNSGAIQCNNGETTIMDASMLNSAGNVVHCDGRQGPAAVDITRVRDYWSKGRVVDFSVAANGSVATASYASEAWAPQHLSMAWLRFYSQDGGIWAGLGHQRIEGTGVHRLIEYRLFTDTFDRVAEGQQAGRWKECGTPYFIMFNMYDSVLVCSKAVTLA